MNIIILVVPFKKKHTKPFRIWTAANAPHFQKVWWVGGWSPLTFFWQTSFLLWGNGEASHSPKTNFGWLTYVRLLCSSVTLRSHRWGNSRSYHDRAGWVYNSSRSWYACTLSLTHIGYELHSLPKHGGCPPVGEPIFAVMRAKQILPLNTQSSSLTHSPCRYRSIHDRACCLQWHMRCRIFYIAGYPFE